jgi:site-specific DNA recombinase
MTNAAIYARISKDDGTALGVARQVKDCTAEAEKRGWTVTQVYRDNDVSASSTCARPAWQRLVADVEARRVDAIVVWSAERLTRKPREAEDVIEWAEKYGLALANIGGDADLSTPDGRMMFRIRGALSRHESEQSSRRIRRKFLERAESGAPHGMVAYGYRRVNGRDELDPEQADVIRETARRLLAGESLRSIVACMNEAGALSPRGKRWESATLRQIMLRDRNAGLRRHQGQVIGKGDWEPVYDEDTHTRVVALLSDPARRTNRGAAISHLLTGIARCGLCGGGMRVIPAQVQKSGKRIPKRYGCRDCFRITRKQADVDAVVEALVVGRLSMPDALSAIASGDPGRAEQLHGQIEAAEARLAIAADGFADGDLTGDQLRRVTAKLRPQVEAWRDELAACAPRPGLVDLAGLDAEAKWATASIDVRRSAVETLVSVRILPQGVGRSFDPETVEITWR